MSDESKQKGRIVDVRHWSSSSGTPAATVTRRYRRKLYATTTFHHLNGRRYLPSHLIDQRVAAIGEWRAAS